MSQAIFATEKTIKETEGKGFLMQNVMLPKLPLMTLRKRKKTTTDEMKVKTRSFGEKAQGLAVKLYEQAAAAQQAQAGAERTSNGNANDVVRRESLQEK